MVISWSCDWLHKTRDTRKRPEEASSTRLLAVGLPLRHSIQLRFRDTLYVYQAINFFELPGPKLDIIYVGSSLSNTFKRLHRHEKWGRMQAEKKRNEDILVYFAELEGDALRYESANGFSLISHNQHG